MKKYIYTTAIVALALMSCSKSETTPASVIEEDIQISFTPAAGKASTKAPLAGTSYPKDLPFGSIAIYENANPKTEYIAKSEVYYKKDKEYWSTEKTYYWPKSEGATLAFYSFSPYAAASYFTYDKDVTNGWTISGYNVDENQDFDLMIADAKTGCTSKKDANGVATVFHHKLAYLKAITIKTADDYSETQKFTLKTITLNGIDYKGTYTYDEWTASEGTTDKTLFSGELEFGSTEANATINEKGWYFLLPQKLDKNNTLTVEYEVVTGKTTETVKVDLDFYTLVELEMNKAYTINITIKEDIITWAPSITDWTDADAYSTTVE